MKFIIFTDLSHIQHKKENIPNEADKLAKKIMQEIQKISSPEENISLTHTNGTNVIELDTRWKGSKLKKNLEVIHNFLGCAGIMLDYNPIYEVEDAVKNHDFFKAYPLGVTLIESYANRILKKFLCKNRMENIKTYGIESMSVQPKMILLYSNSIIGPRMYNDTIGIIKIRNRVIVHAADRIKGWREKDLVAMTEYLERIVPCIKELKTIES